MRWKATAAHGALTEETHTGLSHFSGQGRRSRSAHGLGRKERVGCASRKQRCIDVIMSDTILQCNRNEVHTFPLRPRGQVRGRWLRDGRGRLGRRESLRLCLLATLLAGVHCAPARARRSIAGYALRRGRRRFSRWWGSRLIRVLVAGAGSASVWAIKYEREMRTGGCQSGVNSPPAPCLDFTLISSAISLRRCRGDHTETST